ncbi:hypothetical protein EBR78_03530 [bacterium]|nr:hypothetical protein [bacterium]
MKNFIRSALVILVFGLVACTKKEVKEVVIAVSPEDVVKNFVQVSGQAKEVLDKSKLVELCTGEMKTAFENMNDEQFRMYYLNGNISIQELKVLSVNRDKNKAVVHYQVAVENRQGTDITKEVNEREVDLIESPSGWLIESIRPKGTDKLVFSKGMIF